MEAIEIVVYLAIALIIGALILGFIAGWDAPGAYQKLRGIFSGTDEPGYREVTTDDFPKSVLSFWDSCGLGMKDAEETIYVKDEGVLNMTSLFDEVKRASLCKSLQSATFDCGANEDVLFDEIETPSVVVLRCEKATGTLSITG